jgi:hydroxymethylglutaryl-CoA reductase
MGLGSSASYAVAIARAFNTKHELGLDDTAINDIAYECEKLAHGTPSGIDNTLATYGEPLLFSNDEALSVQQLDVSETPPIVIACSHQRGSTKMQVEGVRERRDRNSAHFDALFDQLMNICHGLLNAIGVSTPELEGMIGIARVAGASGAKLTGAGGGGSIVALCPGAVDDVSSALESAGFRTIDLS